MLSFSSPAFAASVFWYFDGQLVTRGGGDREHLFVTERPDVTYACYADADRLFHLPVDVSDVNPCNGKSSITKSSPAISIDLISAVRFPSQAHISVCVTQPYEKEGSVEWGERKGSYHISIFNEEWLASLFSPLGRRAHNVRLTHAFSHTRSLSFQTSLRWFWGRIAKRVCIINLKKRDVSCWKNFSTFFSLSEADAAAWW